MDGVFASSWGAKKLFRISSKWNLMRRRKIIGDLIVVIVVVVLFK